MNPAQRNKRIAIESPVIVPDGAGQRKTTWSPVATVWAKIAPNTASERDAAKGQYSHCSHTLTINYREGITRTMRAVRGSRVFAIEGVINVREENRELQLFCTEASA